MVILGVILLILGLILAAPILFWIGVILIVIGLALWFGGPVGPTGSRRRYY